MRCVHLHSYTCQRFSPQRLTAPPSPRRSYYLEAFAAKYRGTPRLPKLEDIYSNKPADAIDERALQRQAASCVKAEQAAPPPAPKVDANVSGRRRAAWCFLCLFILDCMLTCASLRCTSVCMRSLHAQVLPAHT